MVNAASRYPLQWPAGRSRTSSYARKLSKFKTTFAAARDLLFREVSRLGAKNVVLSTNVELRADGIPYANRREPEDQGVAVYFDYKGKAVCFACDRWNKIHDNMHAVLKTIEAIRGIARWGSEDVMDAAFSGYTALPPSSATLKNWWEVLDIQRNAPAHVVADRYKVLVLQHHPDRGGSQAKMIEINLAHAQFLKERIM